MLVRKTLAGAVVAALAASAVALSAGAAHAVEADDPGFTPVAGDLIGVGSDTTQHVMHLFAESWNADPANSANKIASFAATGGGNITLPSGDIARPNGSGAGKSRLYGANDTAAIDFARSSSANSGAETSAGLQAFPFALDTLTMVVSKTVASNAPAALTTDDIVKIYNGTYTNWNQVTGGSSGTIVPMIPQSGSGTRSFFVAQLKAMNGGVDVTLGGAVTEVQEHDATPIQSNPNAIAPFSEGRAVIAGSVQVETGWSANRAVYNVVRGADVSNELIQAAFGSDGALCSIDSRDEIEAAGFKQLATPAQGGVCGEPTQSATSNFTLNEQVVTTTTLAATSTQAKKATLTATVTADTSPSGTVDFFEGETEVASDVPLTSGAATTTLTVTPGDHTYYAVFTGDVDSVFLPSTSADAMVSVKTSSKTTESFPATVAKGKKAKGTITVMGDDATATGKVTLKEGSKTLASGNLKDGKVTFTLTLKKGKHSLTATYAGSSTVAGSSKAFTITQK